MIILVDAEKAFHKNQNPLVIKILKKLGVEGKFLNMIEGIYKKSTVNIILNGGKLDVFPINKIRNKAMMSAFTTSI